MRASTPGPPARHGHPGEHRPRRPKSAVKACRYPPLGNRSWGPARASLQRSSYTPEGVNETTVCVVMIENPAAVELAPEILAVPGVDAVYIGPWDLSLSITARPPTRGLPDKDAQAIEAVRQAAVSNGVAPGIACGGIEDGHPLGRSRLQDDRGETPTSACW